MTPLWRKSKKSTEETVLVVDVESGSVAAALVRLVPGELPKLFAEHRVPLPLAKTMDAATLARAVEKAAREALSEVSLLAARLRNAQGGDSKLKEKIARMGAVSRAALFFAPPWAALEERRNALGWVREPLLARALRTEIETIFGLIPISEYSFGEAAAGTLCSLFQQPDEVLLCTIGGEVAELLRLSGGAPQSHATIPFGSHMLVRTLGTHAELSSHEARSALAFARQYGSDVLHEPLAAAAIDFRAQLGAAAAAMSGSLRVAEILVLAPEPAGEWFARALAGAALVEPFDEQSAVRALHTHHLAPYITAHAPVPDLMLMTEGIFIDTRALGVY